MSQSIQGSVQGGSSEGLLRGSGWLLGGFLLCGAVILAQSAFLHAVAAGGKKSL